MFTRNASGTALRIALATVAFATGGTAKAAPGDSFTLPGQAQARVVEPVDIQPVADLRFGRIMQPASAGTLTVRPDGTTATTGGVTGNANTPQAVNGRGPAVFALFGDPNRRFNASTTSNTSLQITVTSSTASMTVNQFRDNTGPGFDQLDSNGYYALFVGARLNVNANQQVGNYTGNFLVTVRYN